MSNYVWSDGAPGRPASAATDVATEAARAESVEALTVKVLAPPSGDGTGATDRAAIQAAIDAIATISGFGTVKLSPSPIGVPYVVASPGVVVKTGVTLDLSGQKIQTAAGANCDAVSSYQFSSLTLTGSSAGISDFAVINGTLDGNKANNTSGYGLRLYGYRYRVENVTFQNCANLGLYTEWGAAGVVPGSDAGMESKYVGLRIHDNAQGGWLHRGPHDSHYSDVIIYKNGSSAGPGLQTQSPASTSIASGSNGVDVASFTGAGVLSVGCTVGYPTAGTLTVATANGNQTVAYTGISGKTFTGCSSSGSGVMSTAGAIGMPNGGYSGSGLGGTNLHVWGPHTVSVQADNASILATNFQIEGGQTGNLWLRSGNSCFVGGRIFSANVTGAFGLKLGDTLTGYATLNNYIVADIGQQDFTGTSAATASVDFNNSTADTVIATVSAGSGTSHITGTIPAACVVAIRAYGQTAAINAGNSTSQDIGGHLTELGTTTSESWQVSGSDVARISGVDKMIEGANGVGLKLFSAAYGGQNTAFMDGLKGHIGFAVRNGQSMSTTAGAAAGTSPPTATLQSSASDVAGETNGGSGTSPATGAYQNVVFAQAYTATPIVVITPQNAATAALGGYVTSKSANGFTISVAVAPAASQAVGTYIWDYVVIARGS